MNLTKGTKLGPYEIISLIGAGGMGEVYRARDNRLGRDVAVKVLPPEFATHPERVRRFEQEARAAGALNHPNIVAIYDVGDHEGVPYLVTELLEGESLRERLSEGKVPMRRALDIGSQIAEGLAAAHDKAIVHRDLKPANVFVTKDGRAKILDFGLARLVQGESDSAPDSRAPTADQGTRPGTVLGTVGYMSPEQVKGRPANARSDIFSLGVILYEMLSGKRAFAGDSEAEVMTAILKDDPAPLATEELSIPSLLERTVTHCLEKNPDRRFQSARDVVFALESVSSGSGISVALPPLPEEKHKRALKWTFAGLALTALGVGLIGAGLLWGRREYDKPIPRYSQLTFRRGIITSARFSPDGNTVYFSAIWGGGTSPQICARRLDALEPTPLGPKNAQLLAVSSGEMAVLLRVSFDVGLYRAPWTLARVPLGGGGPREIANDVFDADYAPGTTNLAIVRLAGKSTWAWDAGMRQRLEYPIGTVLYEADGRLAFPRFSPTGEWIAIVHGGSVMVVDLKGNRRVLTEGWNRIDGLAWDRTGREIWFTGAREGGGGQPKSIFGVDLKGHVRLVSRVPGDQVLQDMSHQGKALLTRTSLSMESAGLLYGDSEEHDLSLLGRTRSWFVSEDGKKAILFEEIPGRPVVYLVRAGDPLPVRLCEGEMGWVSPDEKWVLVADWTRQSYKVVPTGPGETIPLPKGTITDYSGGRWFPEGNRIMFGAREKGRSVRLWVQDVPDGLPRPVTPEGFAANYGAISPDGRYVASAPFQQGQEAIYSQYPIDGGEPLPIPGIRPGEHPVTYSSDGRCLYVREHDVDGTTPVCKLNLRTGRREPWRTLRPKDPAGVISIFRINISMNGRYYTYDYYRWLDELFVAEWLR